MKLTLAKLGNRIILCLVFILLVLWLLGSPLSLRFSSLNQTLTSFGQISGLAGFFLLCLVIILKSRLHFFEKYFGGMNRVYIIHHDLGGIAFILIMFHPIFLTVKYLLLSTQSAAMFLLPGKDIYITAGIIAFLFLSLFLVITFYLNLPYHLWKKTHAFLIIVFIISIFHSFFIYSDLLVNLSLKLYVGFFVIAGIAFTIYQLLAKFNLVGKTRYVVIGVRRLSDQVSEIELKPRGVGIKYLPGQFVFVNFKSKSISKEAHPYSITSCPEEDTLKITVKNLGDYTGRFHLLQKGDLAYLEGPFGHFSMERFPNKFQLWIAGGVGITPFLSMAQSLKDDTLDVYLYYSVLDKKGLIEAEKLQNIAHKNPAFHVVFFLFNEKGLLTAEILKKEVPNLEKREIFICGPGKMMSSLRRQLVALDIDNNSIHTEEFSL